MSFQPIVTAPLVLKAVLQVKKVFSDNEALQIMKTKCCPSSCLINFNIAEVRSGRQTKINKSWVFDRIQTFRPTNTQECFVAFGKQLCSDGWCKLYGISRTMFTDACKLHDNAVVAVTHGNKDVMRYCERSENTRSWLRGFIQLFGEFMPHMDLTLLPSALTWREVYQRMYAEYHKRGQESEIVRRRRFYQILHEGEFKQVNIRKEGMFTKCTMCQTTISERDRTLDKKTRKALQIVTEKHLDIVRKERETYQRHKSKARSNNKYLCIAVDGMDQSKTSVPHLPGKDKASAHLWRLRTHVTGAIVHHTGKFGKDIHAFVNTADVPSDSNLTLNVLMKTLEAYVKKWNHLPEVLYLQFDNCWRENKNCFILGFAYLLVALKIVKKVRINFLLVGHTHNDVDQIFSRISEMLRRIAALTLDGKGDHLHDFKQWIQPHFYGQFKHHTGPHCFRIKRINGEVLMHHRQYSGDAWEPSNGLKCLKSLPEIGTIPPWIELLVDRIDIPMLKNDIPKFKHRMDKESQVWWTMYLSNIKDQKKVPPIPEHWPMMTILAAANESVTDSDDDDVVLPENVQSVWDKLTRDLPNVTIGNQGKHSKRAVELQGTCSASLGNIQGSKTTSTSHGALSDGPTTSNVEDGTIHSADTAMSDEEEVTNDVEDSTIHSVEIDDENDLDQFKSLQPGMMVATYVEYRWPQMCPQIGQVKKIEDETVTVHWYHSTWRGKCTPAFNGGGKYRTPNEEDIDIRSCVLWDFKLTSKNKALTGNISENLRTIYRSLNLSV